MLLNILTLFTSYAIVIRDDQTYENHSVLLGAPELASVLRLRASFGTDIFDSRSYTASAVYIGYGFFLTAGHVLYGDGRDLMSINILGRSGSTITSARPEHARMHPGFSGESFAGTYASDLGIFWAGHPDVNGLSGTNGLGKALFPAATLWTGELRAGNEITLAGYGRRGTGSDPGTLASGTFAVGKNIYDGEGFGGRVGYFDFDSHLGTTSNLGTSQPHPYEAMVNPGDSGGGWFSPSPEKMALTHITSGIWGNLDGVADGSYGDIGIGVSISHYHEWIQNQAYDTLHSFDPYSYPRGEWATFDTVPEPSVMGLLLTSLFLGGASWLFRIIRALNTTCLRATDELDIICEK